jgi:hypothetical protein
MHAGYLRHRDAVALHPLHRGRRPRLQLRPRGRDQEASHPGPGSLQGNKTQEKFQINNVDL